MTLGRFLSLPLLVQEMHCDVLQGLFYKHALIAEGQTRKLNCLASSLCLMLSFVRWSRSGILHP